jgi:hypothetical protein
MVTSNTAAGVVGGEGGGGRVAVVVGGAGVVAGGLGVTVAGRALWVQPLITRRPARRTMRKQQAAVLPGGKGFMTEKTYILILYINLCYKKPGR